MSLLLAISFEDREFSLSVSHELLEATGECAYCRKMSTVHVREYHLDSLIENESAVPFSNIWGRVHDYLEVALLAGVPVCESSSCKDHYEQVIAESLTSMRVLAGA